MEVGNGCRVFQDTNSHCDHDEAPCAGPFELSGLSGRENFGVVIANNEDDAVLLGQEVNPEVFKAYAINPYPGMRTLRTA
ncbi:MAG: hypothetical protein BGO63_03885 [Candidatus Accumulibacter sp. 66-26]|nr:MAG: hypothetical protein BGO63_03885 [Candidatus Accumulibacter sp. 66-26]